MTTVRRRRRIFMTPHLVRAQARALIGIQIGIFITFQNTKTTNTHEHKCTNKSRAPHTHTHTHTHARSLTHCKRTHTSDGSDGTQSKENDKLVCRGEEAWFWFWFEREWWRGNPITPESLGHILWPTPKREPLLALGSQQTGPSFLRLQFPTY